MAKKIIAQVGQDLVDAAIELHGSAEAMVALAAKNGLPLGRARNAPAGTVLLAANWQPSTNDTATLPTRARFALNNLRVATADDRVTPCLGICCDDCNGDLNPFPPCS